MVQMSLHVSHTLAKIRWDGTGWYKSLVSGTSHNARVYFRTGCRARAASVADDQGTNPLPVSRITHIHWITP